MTDPWEPIDGSYPPDRAAPYVTIYSDDKKAIATGELVTSIDMNGETQGVVTFPNMPLCVIEEAILFDGEGVPIVKHGWLYNVKAGDTFTVTWDLGGVL